MQPAWTDLLDGLSGVLGKDRREKPVLPERGDEEGTVGKQRPRGRENEDCLDTDEVSDPVDTPEDVEDEDEPELFLW